MVTISFGQVEGLPEEEQKKLNTLVSIFDAHQRKNERKQTYYDGQIKLADVNLGIALPKRMTNLEIGCAWGAKTVDVLASRSRFDGFVSENGEPAETMNRIVRRNRLIAAYNKACRDELLFGSTFAAVSGSAGNATIRFYSPKCAAAAWDSIKGRIDCGFAFEDARKDESDLSWQPMYATFYTDTDIWTLSRETGRWTAERYPHSFGRPLMEPLTWNPSSEKPFGQSRLKWPIRKLIQGYVRTVANATIGLEFATSPQKYLLGVTDEQYEALINSSFRAYAGNIMAATANMDTGSNPTFGQLMQGSISPHVEMLRILATQFSAATGLSVTDTGVVNEANPTSSEAIIAQTQTLITLADDLNQNNADSLYQIALMAQAIETGTIPADLTENEKNIVAHFKNPAMPNVASTADAAVKIASARANFADTDVFLEMIGFDQADIRRIKAGELRARGQQVLTSFEETEETEETEE